MPTKTPAQVAAEKKVAAEREKVNAQKSAANKQKVAENAKKVAANKAANTPKPKPTTTYKPNKPAQTIKVTPNKATSKPTPKPTPDKYRYFMGTKDMSQPTKEVNKATFEKGGMPRTKILASDTAKINNLTRSYGASSSKGFVPLKTKTTPKKL